MVDMDLTHEYYMQMAIEQAFQAQAKDEVPVETVLVDEEHCIIARAHNETISQNDPSAHAEILALRNAGRQVKNYRLLATTLYVTVEPCVMCMGAIIHARVGRVVFGTPDPKWGAAGSLYDFPRDHRFNHQPEIIAGICADQCRELMRNFFAQRR